MNMGICKKYNLKYETFSSLERESDSYLYENIGEEDTIKEEENSVEEESLDDIVFD